MNISDFSNRQEEDEDIRLFREDYPDVYDFVLKVLDGNCDKPTLQAFKDEYGEDCLKAFLNIISEKASRYDIHVFLEAYPQGHEEIYNALVKMIQNRKPRREDLPESVPSRETFKKGDFIGQKYEVFGVLGEGACGIVYLVYSHETKSAYALKTFRDEYLEDVTTRERFKKEAQVWIDLERHPYLVRAYFVDEISGRLYIAMENIAPDDEGLNTLEGYLRRRPPDMAQTLRWAIQFCHGMEHAYSKGIKAHRDIKPANIMIGTDKTVKISDFGLAGFIGTPKAFSGIKINPQHTISGETYQTMKGSAFGTPPYMPPEQFENAAGCDERSDIYSFGVVLYQMASGGKLPFYPDVSRSGEGDVFQKWYMLHSKASVPKLKSPLSPVIFRCLEKKPINRYFSFKELRRDFETLLKKQTGEVVKLPERKELEAWELHNKGFSLDTLGKFQEAIVYYEQAININPLNEVLWSNKGISLRNLGKYQEAIASYDRSIEINPMFVLAWNNKGLALDHMGRYEEAIACYNQALKINPVSELAWNNKGITLANLKKLNEAIACYEQAIKKNDTRAEIWYNKGLALLNLGRYRESIVCYDRAIKINPAYAIALNDKGVALKNLNQHYEAIECYDKALEINSALKEAWYNKGNALYNLGRHNDSLDCYCKALELNSADAVIWYAKGLAEDELGLRQAATLSYKKFIDLNPAQYVEQIEYARQRLRELEER